MEGSVSANPDVFDDGPVKPVRIWSRAGRRPIVDVGNSNPDIPMLQFAEKPNQMSLRMLLLHEEAREFDSTPAPNAQSSRHVKGDRQS